MHIKSYAHILYHQAYTRFLMLIATLFILLPTPIHAKVGGLAFLNPANSIEKRTSYSVFGDKEEQFSERLDISFDMRLPYREEVGYIVRVIDKTDNKIFNVFYDGRGNDYFELNREGYKGLIKIPFNRQKLMLKQWFKVHITFNMKQQTISMSIDGERQSVKLPMGKNSLPHNMLASIVFGRSDYLIDVPSFAMRNLVVSDADSRWRFPLKQTSGTTVLDDQHHAVGTVNSPYWLLNDHYHWTPLLSWKSDTPAGHNFFAPNHQLLYYNNDSLYIYNVVTGATQRQPFAQSCPVKLYLGTNFIDPTHHKLYSYEAFREKKTEAEPSVASLNLDTYQWNTESTVQINEGQMHHHGSFYRPDTQQFIIYGGFANMQYSSRFYSYHVSDHHWHMLNEVQGERFPRYFLSMGYDGKRYAYIFGGMGNESGDQTVGRRFFYDLHRYDTRTNRVEKVWNIDWKGHRDIVFSKSMVLTRDSFYTIGYSEFKSNSYIHLYRFSLRDGHFCQLGDSILIHPDRIETETSLYYDSLLHRFIVTVHEYKDERHNTLRAYSINAPAITEAVFENYEHDQAHSSWLPYIIALLAAIVTTGVWLFHRAQRRRIIVNNDSEPETEGIQPNTLYLFGNFTACGRNGRDISYLFTDKLRVLFCLILQHSAEGGISSQQLGYEMWGDKTPEKIKNSKSVAINHLRHALKEFEGVTLVYEAGKFKLNILPTSHNELRTAPAFHCDYLSLLDLLNDDSTSLYERRSAILDIVCRGKFLALIDTPVLDTFKSNTEQLLLKPLTTLMNAAVEQSDYTSALHCIKCIFYIDPTNEAAFHTQTRVLKRLGKTMELQDAIIHYNEMYKKMYGEGKEK